MPQRQLHEQQHVRIELMGVGGGEVDKTSEPMSDRSRCQKAKVCERSSER